MRRIRQCLLIASLTLSGAGSAIMASAHAQNPDEAALYRDNQTRAARLSYVKGAVHIDGAGDPLDGVVNMPVVEGQRISTGDDGEAEIEFEDGSMVRLTPNSAAELNQMTGDQSGNLSTAIGLLGGVYYLDLRASDHVRYTVDAADERIEPRENSVIRVRMDDPPAEISLFEGAATVSRQGGFTQEIASGESIRGDSRSAGRYYLSQQIDTDSWDDWNEQLEQQAANDANLRTDAQVAAGDTTGYGWSDLDTYGNWYDVPGQGQVWQPEQASDPGFDPYGYGNWVYYPTSGYVWVSGYPWGWKPFRCGYWNYIGGFGWGWQPSGCGVGGWGGFGGYGGFSIRIRNYPSGYRPPVRPMPGRGSGWSGGRPPRRVIPIGTRPPISPRISTREGRPISLGGRVLQPLPRRGGYTQRGGSAVGSGLRRDFPMNKTTNRPDIGRPATQPGSAIVPGPGWRAVDNGRGRGNQNRDTRIAPQNGNPGTVDSRRPQYNGGGQPSNGNGNTDRRNQNGQGNPGNNDWRNRGQNSNGNGGEQNTDRNRAVPGANPPVRRNDDGGTPLTVRRPDGSVIQPSDNNGANPNQERRRRDYNGRPSSSTPAPGGVGIPTQPAPAQPQQPANGDPQRQQNFDEQRRQQLQQQRQQMEQQRQGVDQQRQGIDQQRLQQQRQQQIEQMRQQVQQRQQLEQQQRQQQDQQQRQQQVQQEQNQRVQQQDQLRQQQIQQQRQQMEQQQRQQQDQVRQQQMQQMRQQQDQVRQQQMQQMRQQQDQMRQQQMQQRQQQMEQMRQQQQQRPAQMPAPRPAPAQPAQPAPSAPPQAHFRH